MSQETTTKNPLGTERIGKLMVKYSVPGIISLVVNNLYNMVDQVFIGRGVGYLGNAATNIIYPMTVILLAFTVMIGDGGAAFLSLSLGKGKKDDAARSIGNAVTLTIGISVILEIIFLCFASPLCTFFGATEETLPYALDYGRIIFLGFPFSAICAAFGGIIRADGRPQATMTGLLLGSISNFFLDYLFVMVFRWGMQGAAVATIIGQCLNAVYYVVCICKLKCVKLTRHDFIPSAYATGKLTSLGIASFVTQFANVAYTAVLNNALREYGAASVYGSDIPIAAIGIINKVSMLAICVVMGISSGSQPILGYNYGSKQYKRVKQTYKYELISATCILLIASILFQTIPEKIINLFGEESNLYYMEFSVKALRIFLLMTFTVSVTCVTSLFFQALGKPVQSTLLSLSRQIFFLIPLILVLGKSFGIDGVLWAGPVSDMLAALLCIIVVCVFWKRLFSEEARNG